MISHGRAGKNWAYSHGNSQEREFPSLSAGSSIKNFNWSFQNILLWGVTLTIEDIRFKQSTTKLAFRASFTFTKGFRRKVESSLLIFCWSILLLGRFYVFIFCYVGTLLPWNAKGLSATCWDTIQWFSTNKCTVFPSWEVIASPKS